MEIRQDSACQLRQYLDVEYVNGERELRVSDKNIERALGGASSSLGAASGHR